MRCNTAYILLYLGRKRHGSCDLGRVVKMNDKPEEPNGEELRIISLEEAIADYLNLVPPIVCRGVDCVAKLSWQEIAFGPTWK